MAWIDNLKEAAYTSPSGVRVTFCYENVKQDFDKKTTGFNFPDADGTYVQDLGVSGRRYPLRVIFWGSDCDTESDSFLNILSEKGTGRLEHPLYGTFDVVPFGRISRRDDLKTAANQSIVEVTFWATIGAVYPSSEADPESSVKTSVDEFNDAASSSYADFIDIDTTIEEVSLKNTALSLVDDARSFLKDVADTESDVGSEFDTIYSSITDSIDVLVEDPLTLAFQVLHFVQVSSNSMVGILDRLNAYVSLSDQIVGSAIDVGSLDSRDENAFHSKELFATSCVTGSILSVINTEFSIKKDAINAAETILDQFEGVEAWIEEGYGLFDEIDTGAAYQQLQEAVALTVGYLVEISFSLKQERSIVLDRSRTIIDLAAELYGSVDDNLDFLISTNNLSGSEILELERGREIVYYI